MAHDDTEIMPHRHIHFFKSKRHSNSVLIQLQLFYLSWRRRHLLINYCYYTALYFPRSNHHPSPYGMEMEYFFAVTNEDIATRIFYGQEECTELKLFDAFSLFKHTGVGTFEAYRKKEFTDFSALHTRQPMSEIFE